jgi:ribosomal protein L12E/L44/L45/RPP1/RPP2
MCSGACVSESVVTGEKPSKRCNCCSATATEKVKVLFDCEGVRKEHEIEVPTECSCDQTKCEQKTVSEILAEEAQRKADEAAAKAEAARIEAEKEAARLLEEKRKREEEERKRKEEEEDESLLDKGKDALKSGWKAVTGWLG